MLEATTFLDYKIFGNFAIRRKIQTSNFRKEKLVKKNYASKNTPKTFKVYVLQCKQKKKKKPKIANNIHKKATKKVNCSLLSAPLIQKLQFI